MMYCFALVALVVTNHQNFENTSDDINISLKVNLKLQQQHKQQLVQVPNLRP